MRLTQTSGTSRLVLFYPLHVPLHFYLFFFSFLFIFFHLRGEATSSDNHPVTFYTRVPLDGREWAYSMSIVSDSSIWYSTTNGVFHFNGRETVKHLDASRFTQSGIEVLILDAPAEDNVWVLGHDMKSWHKTVMHYDGKRWNPIPFPQVTISPDDDLVVWRLDMFVVGDTTKGYAVGQEGILYYYDGRAWTLLERITNQYLRALRVLSSTDVWIGGKGGVIFHYDGRSWKQSLVEDTSGQNTILDFSFLSPASGWAVGIKGIWQYDGTMWKPVPSPTKAMIRNVAFASENDGWFVSHEGEVGHYDGASWKILHTIPNKTHSTISGMSLIGEETHYQLFIMGTNGVNKAHWGKVATFTDVTSSTTISALAGLPVFGDLDNNGTMDAFFINGGTRTNQVYLNRGDGVFSEMTDRLLQPGEEFVNMVVLADIDNNSFLDIALLHLSGGGELYKNTGEWNFERAEFPVPLLESGPRSSGQFADVDNDGDLDFFYMTGMQTDTSNDVIVYLNDGIGKFSESLRLQNIVDRAGASGSFLLADLDDNGFTDVFIFNFNSPCLLYLQHNGRFSEVASSAGLDGTSFDDGYYIVNAIPFDIDRDGDTDMLLVDRNGKAAFFFNDGAAHFTLAQTIVVDPQGKSTMAVIEDIDSDGFHDVFFVDRFFLNNHGTFEDYSPLNGYRENELRSLVDIDGDNDLDLFHFAQNLKVARNEMNSHNVLALYVRGIKSNSHGIGAKVYLWSEENGKRSLAAYHQVLKPGPVYCSFLEGKTYSTEIIFPGGRTIERSGLAAGTLIIEEFNFPLNYFWDFISSFQRSLKYMDPTIETLKLLIVFISLLMFGKIGTRLNIRRYVTHPVIIFSLVIVYITIVHATIRNGIIYSGVLSVGGFYGITAILFISLKTIVARQEENRLSHYKLLEVLGEGGMGKVYKAIDVNTKTITAVKVLNPILMSNPENKNRLMSEGRLLTTFSHPHILKVYEIGETGQRGYIAMEFLEGGTLKAHLTQHYPLPLDELKRMLLQICSGLEEIHSQNVVHRDIKTANIMFDSHGTIRIMDFGLSKSTLITTMTTLGTVLGTLGYTAPEQVTGFDVDRRADIFSFGVIVYEMLTNQLPFNGENEIAVIHSLFNTTPSPPSHVREGIPMWYDGFVSKCLQKNPNDRFQTMSEVRIALEREFPYHAPSV
jgi:hypothetical protein